MNSLIENIKFWWNKSRENNQIGNIADISESAVAWFQVDGQANKISQKKIDNF